MNSRSWADMALSDKAKCFSEDLAAIWKVHAFREGNTRLAVTFCCQFIEKRRVFLLTGQFLRGTVYTCGLRL